MGLDRVSLFEQVEWLRRSEKLQERDQGSSKDPTWINGGGGEQ